MSSVFCDKRRSLEVGGDTEASLMRRWRRTVWLITLAMVIVTAIGLLAQGLRILLFELGLS
jgi:hypothetical protein